MTYVPQTHSLFSSASCLLARISSQVCRKDTQVALPVPPYSTDHRRHDWSLAALKCSSLALFSVGIKDRIATLLWYADGQAQRHIITSVSQQQATQSLLEQCEIWWSSCLLGCTLQYHCITNHPTRGSGYPPPRDPETTTDRWYFWISTHWAQALYKEHFCMHISMEWCLVTSPQ